MFRITHVSAINNFVFCNSFFFVYFIVYYVICEYTLCTSIVMLRQLVSEIYDAIVHHIGCSPANHSSCGNFEEISYSFEIQVTPF